MRNILVLILIMFIPTSARAVDICFFPVSVVVVQPQSFQAIVPPENYSGWYSATPRITQPTMSNAPAYYSQASYTYPTYSFSGGQVCTGPGCSNGSCSTGACANGACANGSCSQSAAGAFRPFGGYFRR